MEALVERLSHLDCAGRGRDPVVMFYDTLIQPPGGPAGARPGLGWPWPSASPGILLHGTGRAIRVSPDGREPPAPPAPASTYGAHHPRRGGHRHGVAGAPRPTRSGSTRCCWSGSPSPPRRRRAVRTGPHHDGRPRPRRAGDQLQQRRGCQSPGAAAAGLRGRPARSAWPPYGRSFRSTGSSALVCPARPVKAAPLADVGVILATTLDPARFPDGVRAGLSAAVGPDQSWREARTALRFTTSRLPSSTSTSSGRWRCSRRCPRTPRGTTPTWPPSPGWPAPQRIWRRWTSTAHRIPPPSGRPPPPAPQQRRPPARPDLEVPGDRTRRAHRAHAGPARPHRVAAARRVTEIPVPTGDPTLA